jgi:hypothetical protein
MACIRKRRGRWCLDYRDQSNRRHWETTKGNRKEAERLPPGRTGAGHLQGHLPGAHRAGELRGPGASLSGGRQSQRSGYDLQGLSRESEPAPAAVV